MEELIQRIVAKVGVDESIARSAVSVIMSFLHKEGPSEKVEQLAGQIGGDDLLGPAGGDADSTPGGMMGGGAMAVLGELQGLGLGMGEIQGVTQETISFAKEKGGEELVDEIVSAIPGLSQFV
ncbi:MAG: DUF2267 domain-containing protein [Hyphomicrobiales bacterium]|nr:DUF2267 domain-containing protein [Hyphomicrobiales bacterium]